MESLIKLPAVAHNGLNITVTVTGQLRSMSWDNDALLSEADKAEITALEKARLFAGGVLSLPLLMAYHGECARAENAAISATSRIEDNERKNGGHSEPYSKAFNEAEAVQDLAQDKAIRARAWLVAFPAMHGSELALMFLGLVGNHSAPVDLNQAELKALRVCAARIVSGLSVDNVKGWQWPHDDLDLDLAS